MENYTIFGFFYEILSKGILKEVLMVMCFMILHIYRSDFIWRRKFNIQIKYFKHLDSPRLLLFFNSLQQKYLKRLLKSLSRKNQIDWIKIRFTQVLWISPNLFDWQNDFLKFPSIKNANKSNFTKNAWK